MQLNKQEKTLTLAIELQQGLALAKLLDIMILEQKTVRILASVPTITYLREQLALRDTKIVAMEQRMSQLKHAVRDLQQRTWQPMLIIDITDMQQPIKFLGSYTMSHQDNDNKWGCTSTTNNKS
jgi:hypothetical protein